MNILICPDKFKGSLTAKQVCDAIAEGIREIHPKAIIDAVPMADGGEGTCELLTDWHQGKTIEVEVQGPLSGAVKAKYGISADGATAFIEMAEASGLMLLKPAERNPLLTSSAGTGEMIADALNRGVKNIILGIGGSATNDAGIGMASALGYVFLDAGGDILKPVGENLIHIHHLRTDAVHPRLKNVSVTALCDVTNPLYGPDGAAFVYGPQKGADKAAIDLLDAGLRNFRRVVHKQLRVSVDFPGAGAAGGLGAGAKIFLNASMQKGVNYIMQSTRLLEKIQHADVVITGEGKIDGQTFAGKVVAEILRHARNENKTVMAVCGVCDVSPDELRSQGIQRLITLVDEHTTRESAIQHAAQYIKRSVMEEFRDLRAGA